MKPMSDGYPLLGCDLAAKGNFEEVYALAEKFVEIILAEEKSYAEACRAFDIAKGGLESLPLKN